MKTYWLVTLLIVSFACLMIQYFELDARLDAWLAQRTTRNSSFVIRNSPPGDDGCWLETLRIAGWLTVFAIYAVVNASGLLNQLAS